MTMCTKLSKKAAGGRGSHLASSFHMIGAVEKLHGERFGLFADLLEQNKLFVSDVKLPGCVCPAAISTREQPFRRNVRTVIMTVDTSSALNLRLIRR